MCDLVLHIALMLLDRLGSRHVQSKATQMHASFQSQFFMPGLLYQNVECSIVHECDGEG